MESGSILPQAGFFSAFVSDSVQDRALWFKNAMEVLDGCDLLFFDPDNGIEVPSKPCGRKNSSKYVYWKELETAWNRGASLLVFQHFARVKREEYIARLTKELAERTSGATIVPLRTSNVLYLLACHEDHRSRADKALWLLDARWRGQLWMHKAT